MPRTHSRLNRRQLIMIAGVTIFVSVSGCTTSQVFSPTDQLQIPLPTGVLDSSNPAVGVSLIPESNREPLSELTGITLDGNEFTIQPSESSATVINSWASWCAPCRTELPEFSAAAVNPEFSNVAFVGLNVRDDQTAALAFAENLEFPSVKDTDGELLAQIPGVPPQALPSTVILDKQGRIAARIIGPVPPGELAGIIRWVLSNESS